MGAACGKKDQAGAPGQAPPAEGGFEGIFGAELVTKEGRKATKEVLDGKKAVMVYFSAHWCPPCRGFTPVLAKAYGEYAGGDIEVVFVSSDRDEGAFGEYYGEMPWTALPFEKRDEKGALSQRFGVQGIPMLVVLRPDGSVAKDNGRGEVQSSGDLAKALAAWGVA
mmetsp:Transcript_116951/g.342499  ORF Transcript_116951/g.342499 Transcript_116951/m.342499 type:complete len:166 (+) Transcript_116951:56-553(+)